MFDLKFRFVKNYCIFLYFFLHQSNENYLDISTGKLEPPPRPVKTHLLVLLLPQHKISMLNVESFIFYDEYFFLWIGWATDR